MQKPSKWINRLDCGYLPCARYFCYPTGPAKRLPGSSGFAAFFPAQSRHQRKQKAAADKDINGSAYNNLKWFKPEGNRSLSEMASPPPLVYSEEDNFWISELLILSADNKLTRINTGSFEEAQGLPDKKDDATA